MKRKRYIACLLLFVSLLMMAVPVIPHHHHSDGQICMKKDWTQTCCTHQHMEDGDCTHSYSHHHTADYGHCCCHTGCLTTHFFQQPPPSSSIDNQIDSYPLPLGFACLFFASVCKYLWLPQPDLPKQVGGYIESLHGTFIARATGLRAPPFYSIR